MKKFYWSILLTALVLISVSSLTADASEVTAEPYLWNESTKEISDIPTEIEQVPNETIFNRPIIKKTKPDEVSTQAILRTLVRYDQSNATINYTHKLVNRVVVDNRGNCCTATEIWFEAENNGTTGLSGSISLEASAEKQLVVAKVNGTISVGGTLSRSWTKGVKYGAKTTVPAKMRGAITGYIPGTSTNGQMVYKLVTDSTGEVRYEYKPVGGIVPAKDVWNIVPQIPFNG